MGKLVKISATLVAMVFLIALVGCDEPTDTPKAAHNHVWSDWKSSADKHWKECTAAGCTDPVAKSQEGAHDFGDDNKCKNCGYEKKAEVIAVESIGLDVGTTFSLAVGGTKKLTPSVKPDTATDKTVTWKTSNSNVATVKDGEVTAVAKGTATITAEAGGKKVECTVIVTDPTSEQPAHNHVFGDKWNTDDDKHWKECTADGCGTPIGKQEGEHDYNMNSDTPNRCIVCGYIRTVAVEKVELNETTITLKMGATKKLTATVEPSNATTKVVTWDSKNEAIAKVDTTGNVEAVGMGSAEITATADGETATCTVTVIEADPPVENHEHDNGDDFDGKDDEYHWKQCNGLGCNEDGGKVEKAAHTWVDGRCSICGYNKPIVAVTNIVIEEKELKFVTGDAAKTLTFKVIPEDATDKTISWTSSRTEVATVENGTVTPIKGGKTIIIAKIGTIEATCSVTVECGNDEHKYDTYTDNGNGTHGGGCSVCGKELEATDHEFNDEDMCDCGAHKPLSEFKVIQGKNDDIESMKNNESNLEAYNTNLDKYTFGEVEKLADGNYKVTCDVKVSALKEATAGDAIGEKNIVAILEFDELKTFAIENITKGGQTVFGSNASWVSDAHMFVQDVAANKTYVTLWMSMKHDADGKIPDRTYEIKAYADDPNPKTLTFKFNDMPSEVSSFDELKTAVENDYANIKLMGDITVDGEIRIAKTATIDLNGFALTTGVDYKWIFAGVKNVETKANVTIKDSSNNHSGKIINDGSFGLAARYGGTLTLENVTLTEKFYVSAAETSTLNIKGSTITCEVLILETSTLNIENSQITGHTDYAVIACNSSTVSISDSVINGSKNGEEVNSPAICVGNGTEHTNEVTVTLSNSKVIGGKDNSAIYKPLKAPVLLPAEAA